MLQRYRATFAEAGERRARLIGPDVVGTRAEMLPLANRLNTNGVQTHLNPQLCGGRLTLQRSPTPAESVAFMYAAMHQLSTVKRNASAGTSVPGGYYVQPQTGRYESLTRNYYGNRSRYQITKECKAQSGIKYASNSPNGVKRSCDEYPFASTYQNANYSTSNTPYTWAAKALT
ncbi:hypothetical protein Drose_16050 [Dactylosporangium roseum]|uniref:Deoxyribonuclease NucA/NucB domain-containing protein n=1 Tax=Dactylosporangium roseum TaxID=47989 RepID=A0ABY5ZF64_9ACTN|nr:hypothetical protein [Dactylosporangium roseum]UWZ39600.1 hypothetical protein Drose_16050 [Dactylosporangium roseum]